VPCGSVANLIRIYRKIKEKLDFFFHLSPIYINPFRNGKTHFLLKSFRPCLPRDWLGFVRSSKFFFSKSTSIFLFFISHQSLFITFQIKKSLQNKKFYFSIKNILTFFLLSIKSATVPIHYFQSNPFPNTTLDSLTYTLLRV
jgi:hypothetical protein